MVGRLKPHGLLFRVVSSSLLAPARLRACHLLSRLAWPHPGGWSVVGPAMLCFLLVSLVPCPSESFLRRSSVAHSSMRVCRSQLQVVSHCCHLFPALAPVRPLFPPVSSLLFPFVPCSKVPVLEFDHVWYISFSVMLFCMFVRWCSPVLFRLSLPRYSAVPRFFRRGRLAGASSMVSHASCSLGRLGPSLIV